MSEPERTDDHQTAQPLYVLPRTEQEPDSVAVRTEDGSLTWAELEDRARRFARGLRAEGVAEHDTWAVLARNRLEWAELTLGNARAGSRYVPLNYHLTAAEMAELLTDSAAKLLVVGSDDEAIGRAAAADVGIDRVIVLGSGYETWLADQSPEPLADCSAGAALQYTGGTTGRSKGVIRSGASAKASELARPFALWGSMTHMPSGEQMMLVTPAYHALGGAVLMASMALGNPLIITDRWDPVRMLALIEQHGVVGVPMVPTQFIRLLKLDAGVARPVRRVVVAVGAAHGGALSRVGQAPDDRVVRSRDHRALRLVGRRRTRHREPRRSGSPGPARSARRRRCSSCRSSTTTATTSPPARSA